MSNRKYIIGGCIIVAIIIFILYKYNKKESFKNSSLSSKLILYYSPDCGHCHHFMPIWEQFRKRAIKLNVDTVKINCKDNKCEEIYGFPTIILQKSDGTKKTFDGDRTIENLERFVSENN